MVHLNHLCHIRIELHNYIDTVMCRPRIHLLAPHAITILEATSHIRNEEQVHVHHVLNYIGASYRMYFWREQVSILTGEFTEKTCFYCVYTMCNNNNPSTPALS